MSGSTRDEEKERTHEQIKKRDKSPGLGKGKAISGTSLKVYRLLYSEGSPLSVPEVQKRAVLSSPSLAYYHLNKLVEDGLAQQKDGGYVVDKVLFESMIRIRRSVIPLETTFAAFFATMIVGLVGLLRPYSGPFPAIYIFALTTNCVAFGIFAYQTFATFREYHE